MGVSPNRLFYLFDALAIDALQAGWLETLCRHQKFTQPEFLPLL
jgi:hypothetical protein